MFAETSADIGTVQSGWKWPVYARALSPTSRRTTALVAELAQQSASTRSQSPLRSRIGRLALKESSDFGEVRAGPTWTGMP